VEEVGCVLLVPKLSRRRRMWGCWAKVHKLIVLSEQPLLPSGFQWHFAFANTQTQKLLQFTAAVFSNPSSCVNFFCYPVPAWKSPWFISLSHPIFLQFLLACNCFCLWSQDERSFNLNCTEPKIIYPSSSLSHSAVVISLLMTFELNQAIWSGDLCYGKEN